VLTTMFDSTTIGSLFNNGTWTGVLGEIQSGVADMWDMDAYITLKRSASFLFTTAYMFDKYGALMERQVDTFYIDVNGLTADINVEVYAILCALLLSLIVLAYINERWHPSAVRNSTWHLLHCLFPINALPWPNQFGATRKVLMATSGFAILILSSLYQAKQSEVLMVPYPPPKFTLKDIENFVLSGRAKLMFNENFEIVNYVSNMSTILADSMPPMYLAYHSGEELNIMHEHNGIFIAAESAVLDLLSNIEPELCKKYVYKSFDDWTKTPIGLILRKERRNMLESMNAIVAERMSFVDDYIQSLSLNEKCREHLFPVYTSNPTYSSLKLVKVSGAFVFLFLFLCFAFIIFIIECLFVWWRPRLKTFHIVISYDRYIPLDTQKLILIKYAKMQDLVARKTEDSYSNLD
jgi:hypothetical protein